MTASPEVLAVRHGTQLGRRSEFFHRYASYGEDDGPARLDFWFWVLRDDRGAVLVDTGMGQEAARSRAGRQQLVPTRDALAMVGVEPDDVTDVVLTHLHWDHVGALDLFPTAQFHVQAAELDFWRGPVAGLPPQSSLADQAALEHLVVLEQEDRLRTWTGSGTLRPGLDLLLVGGHTPGSQVVRVATPRPVVLASDAVHLQEELDQLRPFATFCDLPTTYQVLAALRDERRRGSVVVPGHDPAVARDFPTIAESPSGGLAVRLHP